MVTRTDRQTIFYKKVKVPKKLQILFLIQESGSVVGYFVEFVVGIFRDVLISKSNSNSVSMSDSVDPELQLKMFIILSKQLFETSERIDSQKKFEPFAIRVLEGSIPNIVLFCCFDIFCCYILFIFIFLQKSWGLLSTVT